MSSLPTRHQWQNYIQSREFIAHLQKIYGNHSNLLFERQQAYLNILQLFTVSFLSTHLFFVRVPARINLMGVHIDHQGGWLNYLTIGKELLLAISPRQDEQIHFVNYDPQYQPFQFNMRHCLSNHHQTDWLDYLESIPVSGGSWQIYVLAVCHYFHFLYKISLKGMNVAVLGNIPPAAGLSSSSALVVGTALALNFINNLNLSRYQLTEGCGKAEWFVGTRGGFGDHAAILFGQRNAVTHLRTAFLKVHQLRFPENLCVIACNSHVVAKKSAGARDIFNERVATYTLAKAFLKKYNRIVKAFDDATFIEDCAALLPDSRLYQLILSLPVKMTRSEIRQAMILNSAQLDRLFATHLEPVDGYAIRGVLLFGLGECARSRRSAILLDYARLEAFGALVNVSHDGDRRFIHDKRFQPHPFEKIFDDRFFRHLIQRCGSGDLDEKKYSQLEYQAGGYNCSTQELDLIVDIARSVKGVYGAGLTGAGLGGMVLVMADPAAVTEVKHALEKLYYQPRKLPFSAEECISVDGASILTTIPF